MKPDRHPTVYDIFSPSKVCFGAFYNFSKGVFGSHRIGGLELELEHQFQIFGLDATSARELEFNSNSMGHQFHKFNSLARPKNYNSNSILSPPIRVSTRILDGLNQ